MLKILLEASVPFRFYPLSGVDQFAEHYFLRQPGILHSSYMAGPSQTVHFDDVLYWVHIYLLVQVLVTYFISSLSDHVSEHLVVAHI